MRVLIDECVPSPLGELLRIGSMRMAAMIVVFVPGVIVRGVIVRGVIVRLMRMMRMVVMRFVASCIVAMRGHRRVVVMVMRVRVGRMIVAGMIVPGLGPALRLGRLGLVGGLARLAGAHPQERLVQGRVGLGAHLDQRVLVAAALASAHGLPGHVAEGVVALLHRATLDRLEARLLLA